MSIWLQPGDQGCHASRIRFKRFPALRRFKWLKSGPNETGKPTHTLFPNAEGVRE
jgi:hypothetical protein